MGALDFAGTDGPLGLERGQAIELSGTVGNVATGLPDRMFRFAFRFEVSLQFRQYLGISSRLETGLLFFQSGLGRLGRTTRRGSGQIVAQVIEIDQVASLRAKLDFHLLGNPRRAIAQTMDPTVRFQTRQFRQSPQLPSHLFRRPQGDGKDRRDRFFPTHQTQTRLFPRKVPTFPPVSLPCFSRALHRRNRAAIHFGNQHARLVPCRLRQNSPLAQAPAVKQSDPPKGTHGNFHSMMFQELRLYRRKGKIRREIHDVTLQRQGAGATTNLRQI